MSALSQPTLEDFADEEGEDLDEVTDGDVDALTPTERDVWVAVEVDGKGPRQVMRDRGDSSPGTVSTLLKRARSKVGRHATAVEEGGR